MKELRVLFDDSNGIYLVYEKSKIANKYVILGKDDTFNDIILKETKENIVYLKSDEVKGLVALGVEYIVTDDKTKKDVVIDRTNCHIRGINAYKILKVSAINSYKGITLSYASNTIYDKYYIYEKIDDKYNKILETEDFQINSKLFKEGNTYYIEAYSKDEEGNYILKAKTLDYECSITDYEYNNIDPKVAVVIPAYNASKQLARTIDSIIFSSLKDLEVVIVNDGSKDNTYEIMTWYKNKYPNLLKIVDKPNEGQAKTRYKALNFVNAKYTFYMDADDMVHPEMLSKMYECIVSEDADFVMNKVVAREKFDDYSIFFKHIDDKNNPTRSIVKTYEQFIMDKHNGSYESFYLVTLWHQLGKTELYKAHPMPHFNNYEDIAYIRTIASYGNKFAFQMDSYYVWDKRVGTYFTSTSKESERKDSTEKKSRMYVDAIFYFVNDCNKDRIHYLYYDALKDLRGFVNPTLEAVRKGNKYNNDNIYIEESYKYLKMYDVLDMPLVKDDEELCKIVQDIIMLKENYYDD